MNALPSKERPLYPNSLGIITVLFGFMKMLDCRVFDTCLDDTVWLITDKQTTFFVVTLSFTLTSLNCIILIMSDSAYMASYNHIHNLRHRQTILILKKIS